MSNNPINPEGSALLVKQARAAFIEVLLNGQATLSIPFGGSLMPRETWARNLAMALAIAGAIPAESADAVAAILNSDLGNSSQLGTNLKKEGVITETGAASAATSLASILAQRAQAKATPAV